LARRCDGSREIFFFALFLRNTSSSFFYKFYLKDQALSRVAAAKLCEICEKSCHHAAAAVKFAGAAAAACDCENLARASCSGECAPAAPP
jgi:hypothetical protein